MTEYLELDKNLSQSKISFRGETRSLFHEKQLPVEQGSTLFPPTHTVDETTESLKNLPLSHWMNSSENSLDNELLKFCLQELKNKQLPTTNEELDCLGVAESLSYMPLFRRIEIKSMLSFSNRLLLSPETVSTAVHYFDCVVRKQLVQPHMVPSFSAAALWLATKLHEKETFSSKYFLSYRSMMGTVSKKTLVEAEGVILSILGWKVNVTTAYHYIQIFSFLLRWLQRDFIYMAESLCKYVMMEESLVNFSYSIQAASCIFVSVSMFGAQELRQTLLDSLSYLSISLKDVLSCSEILMYHTFGGNFQVKEQQMSPKSIREWE